MSTEHKGFSSLLYGKTITSGTYSVKNLAAVLNIPVQTFYKYTQGETYFPPDLIATLYNVTKDRDFLNFIIDDTDLKLVPREEAKNSKSVLEEALDVAAAIGGLVKTTQRALADGSISVHDQQKIIKAINQAHGELEDLKVSVERNTNR